MSGHVLVVDDDRDLCRLVEHGLARSGFTVTWRTSVREALEVVECELVDAVVTDIDFGVAPTGLDLCSRILVDRPEMPVAVLTGVGNLDIAVAAIRAGAYDFLTKPLELDALVAAVTRAVRRQAPHDAVAALGVPAASADAPDGLIGDSLAIRRVRDLLARAAAADAAVLIVGESGTGKELVARALHRRSPRRDAPLVAVNCAAIPADLLESELFGHVRGAFSGAHAARSGLFVQADGGTLFLDEIDELPLALQPKLLRALQEQRVRPVGSDAEVPFDARLIVATRRDLHEAVAAGAFRADLAYRIDVLRIELPPLRERDDDVLVLARHFLARAARESGRRVEALSPAAARRLRAHAWPGNVRELENCIAGAVALARWDRLTIDELPEPLRTPVLASPRGGDRAALEPLEAVEQRHVLAVLARAGNNRSLAAAILGVDRKTLYRKLRRWRPR
jgi:two-component system response regulator HydG